MAPFSTPSCNRMRTIVESIADYTFAAGRSRTPRWDSFGKAAPAARAGAACHDISNVLNLATPWQGQPISHPLEVRLVRPLAVHHLDHHAGAFIQTCVIFGRHRKHPLRSREVLD